MSGFVEGTPTVEITLGGKSYTLGWNWGAKRRLKEKLAERGRELSDAAAISENLPAVVWASMDKETRDSVSVEDIEELINPRNEVEVVEKIGSLFTQSEPDVKTNPAAVKEPTAGKSTLTNSSQLASTI